MASISEDANGYKRLCFYPTAGGKAKSFRLGRMTMKQANEVRAKVESILAARLSGTAVDAETAQWLGRIPDRLLTKLAKVGLAEPRQSSTLGEFLKGHIDGRPDTKASTKVSCHLARKRLERHFGADRPLRGITPADADGFARTMKAKYAAATASRTVKRAREFFKAAVRGKLLQANPFADVKAGGQTNPDRLHFIDRATAERLLAECPDPQFRAVIALARYGGLRVPSEVHSLTWADMDWERNRFRVRSPKQEHTAKAARWVPLFPELRPHLEALFDAAEPGTLHVVTINRDQNANQLWRKRLETLIDRAGLTPWPCLWQNFRATRETELAAEYPLHVVTAWIGNSPKVAAAHYLQVTDDDFERAAASGAKSGANAPKTAGKCALPGARTYLPETPETEPFSGQIAEFPAFSAEHQLAAAGLEPAR